MASTYPGSSGSNSGSHSGAGRHLIQDRHPPLNDNFSSSSGSGRRGGSSVEALAPFLRGHTLPALVRLTDADRSAELRSTVDLTQPVLLHKLYQSVKIHARSLSPAAGGSLKEIGPVIVIPDGYRGWFSLLSEGGQSAPYYTSIEEVAAARLAVFLTRHDVPAYVMTDNDQGTVYRKVTVGAGNVLRLMGVFRDLNTSPSTTLAINYAQCVNYKNEVLFLPFSAEGRFYAAATRPTASRDHVFLMSQLLRQQRPPLNVKLVCGFMPRMPCHFTGLLRLEEVRPERLVLGCTTDQDGPGTLFELNADSSMHVQPIVQPQDRHSSPAFTKALVMCERHGEMWRHQMKVSHDVFDDVTASLTPGGGTGASGRLRKTPSLSDRFGRSLVISPQATAPTQIQVSSSSPQLGKPPTPKPTRNTKLSKSKSLDTDRRPARSLRQTVSRFFLSRGNRSGNRDVTTSFVFTRPADVSQQYGRVADDISPSTSPTAGPGENLYAEISEKVERDMTTVAPVGGGGVGGDYTLRLGSDGHSSNPSSPGDTLEHSNC